MADANGSFAFTRALISSIDFAALSSFWITIGTHRPHAPVGTRFETYNTAVHGPDSDGGLGAMMKSGGDNVTLENFVALVEDRAGGGAHVTCTVPPQSCWLGPGAELAIASYTYFNRVGAGQVGCSPNIIIANTEGDL